MCKDSKDKLNNLLLNEDDGGDVEMAILAIPKNSAFSIHKSKTNEFLQESQKNIITQEFLAQCRESASLFKKKSIERK